MNKVYPYNFKEAGIYLFYMSIFAVYLLFLTETPNYGLLLLVLLSLQQFGFTICRIEITDEVISSKYLFDGTRTFKHDEVSSYQVAYLWFSKKQKIKSITLTSHGTSKDQMIITPSGTKNFQELSNWIMQKYPQWKKE